MHEHLDNESVPSYRKPRIEEIAFSNLVLSNMRMRSKKKKEKKKKKKDMKSCKIK